MDVVDPQCGVLSYIRLNDGPNIKLVDVFKLVGTVHSIVLSVA